MTNEREKEPGELSPARTQADERLDQALRSLPVLDEPAGLSDAIERDVETQLAVREERAGHKTKSESASEVPAPVVPIRRPLVSPKLALAATALLLAGIAAVLLTRTDAPDPGVVAGTLGGAIDAEARDGAIAAGFDFNTLFSDLDAGRGVTFPDGTTVTARATAEAVILVAVRRPSVAPDVEASAVTISSQGVDLRVQGDPDLSGGPTPAALPAAEALILDAENSVFASAGTFGYVIERRSALKDSESADPDQLTVQVGESARVLMFNELGRTNIQQ